MSFTTSFAQRALASITLHAADDDPLPEMGPEATAPEFDGAAEIGILLDLGFMRALADPDPLRPDRAPGAAADRPGLAAGRGAPHEPVLDRDRDAVRLWRRRRQRG